MPESPELQSTALQPALLAFPDERVDREVPLLGQTVQMKLPQCFLHHVLHIDQRARPLEALDDCVPAQLLEVILKYSSLDLHDGPEEHFVFTLSLDVEPLPFQHRPFLQVWLPVRAHELSHLPQPVLPLHCSCQLSEILPLKMNLVFVALNDLAAGICVQRILSKGVEALPLPRLVNDALNISQALPPPALSLPSLEQVHLLSLCHLNRQKVVV